MWKSSQQTWQIVKLLNICYKVWKKKKQLICVVNAGVTGLCRSEIKCGCVRFSSIFIPSLLRFIILQLIFGGASVLLFYIVLPPYWMLQNQVLDEVPTQFTISVGTFKTTRCIWSTFCVYMQRVWAEVCAFVLNNHEFVLLFIHIWYCLFYYTVNAHS